MWPFDRGIATEANNYQEETEDKVYIKTNEGLKLFGGVEDDNTEEGE